MKICIVGTGYVGLVVGACFADVGNTVWCVDNNNKKIEKLTQGSIPIFESGLESIVRKSTSVGRLFFTAELEQALKQCSVCFICVDTPLKEDGSPDLTHVYAVAKEIGEKMDDHKIVIIKSTVPVGTAFEVKTIIFDELRQRGHEPKNLLDVVSNPEFLRAGNAVQNFIKPDRIVVGIENAAVEKELHDLYAPFMVKKDRLLVMDIASAELTKYAANSMLAARISFINELARLCDTVGGDITHIRKGIGSDTRIGPEFLYAGLGFGGSCFHKDLQTLIQMGKDNHAPMLLAEATVGANNNQIAWFWTKIEKYFHDHGNLDNKTIAVWGISFKEDTDDVRCAPSLYIINRLIDAGSNVHAFDPAAIDTGRSLLNNKVQWSSSAYDCLDGADALLICTGWHEFRSPDFNHIKKLMNSPVIFDGRNLYDPPTLKKFGFSYFCVGRDRS